MLRMSRNFNFLKKEDPIFGKIRENFGNVPIIQKIIQNYSVVSLLISRLQVLRIETDIEEDAPVFLVLDLFGTVTQARG